MIGPKRFSDEEREKVLMGASGLERALDRLDDESRKLCDQMSARSQEYKTRFNAFLGHEGCDLETLEYTSLSGQPVNFSVSIARQKDWTFQEVRMSEDLKYLNDSYSARLLQLGIQFGRIGDDMKRVNKVLEFLTMADEPFEQPVRQDKAVLYTSRPDQASMKLSIDLRSKERLGPFQTCLYNLNINELKKEASLLNANVYIISPASVRVPLENALIHSADTLQTIYNRGGKAYDIRLGFMVLPEEKKHVLSGLVDLANEPGSKKEQDMRKIVYNILTGCKKPEDLN